MPSRSTKFGLVLFAVTLSGMLVGGCRACSSSSSGVSEAGAAATEFDEPAEGPFDATLRPSREAGPRAGSLDAAIAPSCTGSDVVLERAIVDAACATSVGVAKALRASLEADSGPPLRLHQEARAEAGGRVTVKLSNAGAVPVALPLSWHPRLPAFTVLAEDEHHALFELESPKLEVAADDGGAGGGPRFAKIVLAPGAGATARIAIDTKVVRRLDRRCDDAGVDCMPARLPRGRYVLHVGQLLCDVEAGLPAKIDWDAP